MSDTLLDMEKHVMETQGQFLRTKSNPGRPRNNYLLETPRIYGKFHVNINSKDISSADLTPFLGLY